VLESVEAEVIWVNKLKKAAKKTVSTKRKKKENDVRRIFGKARNRMKGSGVHKNMSVSAQFSANVKLFCILISEFWHFKLNQPIAGSDLLLLRSIPLSVAVSSK
jgi:hypothetical protein